VVPSNGDGVPVPVPTKPTTKPTENVPAPPPPTTAPAPPSGPTGAFPNANNTGVPAGTALTAYSGPCEITTPNTVIDSKIVNCDLGINTTGVMIKNSRINGEVNDGEGKKTSFTIQDSELVPSIQDYHMRGIIGSNFTLVRTNIHHVIDQVLITGDNVSVRDSYFHDNLHFEQDPNYNNTPSHDDGVQISIGKNLRFINNTIVGAKGSAMMITQDRGTVTDLVVSGNYIDGGGCSVNLAEKSYGPYKGLTFKDNVFGRTTTVAAFLRRSHRMRVGSLRWIAGTPRAVHSCVPGCGAPVCRTAHWPASTSSRRTLAPVVSATHGCGICQPDAR